MKPTPRTWLAHPWVSLVVAASWLLLQGSLAPAHLLWAVILGLGLPWLLHRFLGQGSGVRALGQAGRLAGVVLYDIVVSNLVVARIVLDPGVTPQPAWVRVRYTVTDSRAIALLATIITTTPGTVSCVIDQVRGEILVHALNAVDPQSVEADILARYDRPLKEIFG
jgi:multicomponent K+:H+ antiporter subunit E